MTSRLHLNWSRVRDWNEARARLTFLGTTLYGNFAYVDGDADAVMAELAERGFTVTSEPYVGGETLLRLSRPS